MKKFVKFILIISCIACFLSVYWETWNVLEIINTDKQISTEVESNPVSIDLEQELKNDWINLESATETKNIVDKANEFKNTEIQKVFWTSDEDKNINMLKDVLSEVEIKKELNEAQLLEIQENIKLLQKNIEENNKTLKLLNAQKIDESKQIFEELNSAKSSNQELEEELKVKQNLILDLQKNSESYSLLDEKYKKLLETYVEIKKDKDSSLLIEKREKLFTWAIFLLLFVIAYIAKIVLLRNEKFSKRYKNFWEYFNFAFWLIFIIFLIIFAFYLFPELYAVFILISWTLLIVNSQVVSSFVASLVLFRNFKIWDVIKIWDEKWRIIKMNPISTVIRKINSYWVLANEETNIPNIDMIKDKVTIAKNRGKIENNFSVIFSLSQSNDIFDIIKHIKYNILWRKLKDKLYNVNYFSDEKYKIKYEYIDSDKIKVTFYWIAEVELSKKIETEIIKYVKKFAFYDNVANNKSLKNINWENEDEIHQDYIKKSVTVLDDVG